MALILNIDTATDLASVCISENERCIAMLENGNQKEHASFVHVAIAQLVKNAGITLDQLDGIAVTNGPGSYTGLRVGLATAKGLCYALTMPLITVSTLQVMAHAALPHTDANNPDILLCPMIDARRMEVFTALYNKSLEEIMPPCAMVLAENVPANYLENNSILFFGNGSIKLQPILKNKNAHFIQVQHTAADLATLAWRAFQRNEFTELAYAQPNYLKEFYSTAQKLKH